MDDLRGDLGRGRLLHRGDRRDEENLTQESDVKISAQTEAINRSGGEIWCKCNTPKSFLYLTSPHEDTYERNEAIALPDDIVE